MQTRCEQLGERKEVPTRSVCILAVRRCGALGKVGESAGVLAGINAAQSKFPVRISRVRPRLWFEVDAEGLGGLADRHDDKQDNSTCVCERRTIEPWECKLSKSVGTSEVLATVPSVRITGPKPIIPS